MIALSLALLLTAGVVVSAVTAPVIPAGNYEWRIMDAVENRLIELTNNYRAQNGVGPLAKSNVLRYTALYKSLYMAHYDDYDYDFYRGPLAGNAWNAPFSGFVNAESVLIEFPDNASQTESFAQMLFEDWLDSAPENMLRADYAYIGVGVIVFDSIVADGEAMENVCYATQHFSADLSGYSADSLPPQLSNKSAASGSQPGRPSAPDGGPRPPVSANPPPAVSAPAGETPSAPPTSTETPTPTPKRTPPPRPTITPTPEFTQTPTPTATNLPALALPTYWQPTVPPTTPPPTPIVTTIITIQPGPSAGTIVLFGLLGSVVLAGGAMGVYMLIKRRKNKVLMGEH